MLLPKNIDTDPNRLFCQVVLHRFWQVLAIQFQPCTTQIWGDTAGLQRGTGFWTTVSRLYVKPETGPAENFIFECDATCGSELRWRISAFRSIAAPRWRSRSPQWTGPYSETGRSKRGSWVMQSVSGKTHHLFNQADAQGPPWAQSGRQMHLHQSYSESLRRVCVDVTSIRPCSVHSDGLQAASRPCRPSLTSLTVAGAEIPGTTAPSGPRGILNACRSLGPGLCLLPRRHPETVRE